MIIHLAQAERERLGSFDPSCFTVDFRTATAGSDAISAEQLLSVVPDHLFAHEFAHFIHAVGTRAGIYNYACSVDYIVILSALALLGEIDLPGRGVADHDADAGTVSDLRRLLRRHASEMLVECGGLRLAEDSSSSHWYQELYDHDLVRLSGKKSLPLSRMIDPTGRRSRMSLGYRQLTEGIGHAVELIRLGAAPTNIPVEDQSALPIALDPYVTALALYFSGFNLRERRSTSLQEFICVAETALMLTSDLNLGTHAPGWMHERLTQGLQNSFSIYAHLLGHLHGRRAIRLQDVYTVDAWIAFQQELLRTECGQSASFQELTEVALVGLDAVVQHQLQASDIDLLQRLIPVYARSARLTLETRLEYADGTSLAPTLLGTREEMTDAFLSLVPVFSVGTYLVGDPELVNAAAHLRLVRDASEVAVFGDAPCPWDTGQTRSCSVPRQNLCVTVAGFQTAAPCGRKTSLQSLIARSADDDLSWVGRPPRT